MNLRLLVDGPEFWTAFEADARAATTRVFVQTLGLEADEAGHALAALLVSLVPRVECRLVIDDYSHYLLNDRFLYSPRALADAALWREARATYRLVRTLRQHGVEVCWVNPVRGRPYRLAARNHKKILVVDDAVSYFGGINFTAHNFAWHDLMVRVEDPALAGCLRDDVLATFAGRNQALDCTVADGRLILLDGVRNPALQRDVVDLVCAARDEVFIESPYVSGPYLDALEAARRGGARVMIATPAANNWSLFDGYLRAECQRRRIELWHLEGMSHLKAMLVDGRQLVLGSSNFDYFAHHTHQELLFLTRDRALIDDFRTRVRDVDLAGARRAPASAGRAFQPWVAAQTLRWGFPVVKALNRLL